MDIAVVNASNGAVTDDEVRTMCLASTADLGEYCAAWNLVQPVISFHPTTATIPKTAVVIPFVDQPPGGDQGADAWHSDSGGKPNGLVFAGFMKANGSRPFDGDDPISRAFDHEVKELLRDPRCTLSVMVPVTGPDGKQYAGVDAEVCDPVQGTSRHVKINGVHIAVSAFVLPGWEDPTDPGPWDSEEVLPGPLTVAKDGYAQFRLPDGSGSAVFGEKVPVHVQALKSAHGRISRKARRP